MDEETVSLINRILSFSTGILTVASLYETVLNSVNGALNKWDEDAKNPKKESSNMSFNELAKKVMKDLKDPKVKTIHI